MRVRHSIVYTTLYLCLCLSWPTLAAVCDRPVWLLVQHVGMLAANLALLLPTLGDMLEPKSRSMFMYILCVKAPITALSSNR